MSTRKIFIGVLGLVLVAMLVMSINYGPSNDEIYQAPYGARALDYYTSFTQNDSVLNHNPEPLMKHYGAIVDMAPEAISRITGSDLMTTRHVIITLFSFLYILFGALIAKRIGGYSAGFFAIALLTLLPRVFGEAMNNPKDLPFAATYLLSIYAFMYFIDALPKPSKKAYFILFFGFLATMLVRVSGLLCVFYFVLFALWEWFVRLRKDPEFKFGATALKTLCIGLLGYLVSIFMWPAMFNSPLIQPLDTLKTISSFPIIINTLFEGNYIVSDEIPLYYTVKYFLISNPEITLLGILIGLVLFIKMIKRYSIRRLVFLLFAALFPLLLILFMETPLYTGWRHTYFIFVCLAVFSAISFAFLYDNIAKSKKQKWMVIAVVSVGLFFPLKFMLGNFPYFYTYFNDASGGTKSAMGYYELDYYSHALKPATDWLIKNVPDLENKKIASNNYYQVGEILKTNGIKKPISYVRYRERYDSDWDYALMTQSFVDAEYLQNGYFPPKGTVKVIAADGAPICAIIKREDRNSFLGKKAMDSLDYPLAIEYLSKAVQYDRDNEMAWTNLGFAQLNMKKPKIALQSLKNAIKITPGSMMAKNYLAYAYLHTGNSKDAFSTLIALLEEDPSVPEPYILLAQIYTLHGDTQMAKECGFIYQQIMKRR